MALIIFLLINGDSIDGDDNVVHEVQCPIENGDTIVNCALHTRIDQKHISCISGGSETGDKRNENNQMF